MWSLQLLHELSTIERALISVTPWIRYPTDCYVTMLLTRLEVLPDAIRHAFILDACKLTGQQFMIMYLQPNVNDSLMTQRYLLTETKGVRGEEIGQEILGVTTVLCSALSLRVPFYCTVQIINRTLITLFLKIGIHVNL